MIADLPPAIHQQVQHVQDAADRYLDKRGIELRRRVFIRGVSDNPLGLGRDSYAAIKPFTGDMVLSPEAAHDFAVFYDARKDPTRDTIYMDAPRAALHEALHVYNPAASEGLVDAVAIDLTRGFTNRYTRDRWSISFIEPGYPRLVAKVRQQSARWCGAGWRGKCARQYRLWRLSVA